MFRTAEDEDDDEDEHDGRSTIQPFGGYDTVTRVASQE
jgi:hypothetical protein